MRKQTGIQTTPSVDISRIRRKGRIGRRKAKAITSLAFLGLLVAFILSAGFGGLSMASGATGSNSGSPIYNNVHVLLQTQNSSDNYYALDVYNSTGALVASSQSQYPIFSFDLPKASYIFTGTALYSGVSRQVYGTQDMEYGYQIQEVSDTTSSITILTQNIADIPATHVSIQATLPNRSAAAGASISAEALGSYYFWGGSNFVMWNETNNLGSATLNVPNVPLEVTAWDWVYVNLPSSVTTVQTNVAGQPVNVTVYWQPMYLPFSGTTLLIPGQSTSTQIALKYSPEQNYCLPFAAASSAEGGKVGAMPPSSASSNSASSLPCYYYGTSNAGASQASATSTIAPSPQLGSSIGIASPALLPSSQTSPRSATGSPSSSPPSIASLLGTETVEVATSLSIVSAIGVFAFLAIRRARR